jgi:alpha-beta hydrolase superfamily lysophospholipase
MAGNVFDVTLPNGHLQKGMAYTAEGTKKNLLIMTGMNEHATRYEDLAGYLNAQGFDVYVLDAIAQGLNAPKVEDQEKWFVGAFDENVQAANIEIELLKKGGKPTYLMGHSMGSFMVQRYLELYPNTVVKVIEMGSNGPALAKMKMAYGLAKILVNKKNWDKPCKPLSNAGLGAYAKAVKNRKTDLDWLSYNEENVKKYMADPYCGHEDTGGFWHEFLKGMATLYKKNELKKISKDEKILIISGSEDPVGECSKGSTRLAEMYRKLGLKDVTLVLYPHMRHEIHNEKDHAIVYKQISDFLNA